MEHCNLLQKIKLKKSRKFNLKSHKNSTDSKDTYAGADAEFQGTIGHQIKLRYLKDRREKWRRNSKSNLHVCHKFDSNKIQ